MSEAQAAEPGAVDGPSAGTLLRGAREAAGLHVAALAVSLKVPVSKLEALEADRFDLLPDAVFTRALASSVCRVLKIDAQPILDRLPRSGAPRLAHDSQGINAPFRAPGEGARPGWVAQLTRPVALTVGGLLVAALVLVFLPTTRIGGGPPAPQARTEPVLPPGAPTNVSLAPADTAATASSAGVPATPAAAPARTADTPPVAPAPAASAPAVVPAAAAAPAASAAAATPGLVVFRTRGPSWVEVVDAKGQTVLRRLMEGGEAASASGPLPLMVTVGSVGATEVQVRGRPFDLGPVSRDNVARFEVK